MFQTTLAVCVLAAATTAFAQESGIRVRSVRVLATDPEAIATFYMKAFGMSETRRVGNAGVQGDHHQLRHDAGAGEESRDRSE